MKSFARVAAFGFSLAGLCCGEAFAAISYEEALPAFRNGVDRYSIHVPASGEWKGDKFVVSVTNRQNFFMSYSRFPGMKPFRGADGSCRRVWARSRSSEIRASPASRPCCAATASAIFRQVIACSRTPPGTSAIACMACSYSAKASS